MFSERTLKALTDAGWSENYQFDPTDYKRELVIQGYEIFEAADEFLRKYGGLYLNYVHPRYPALRTTFHLNAAAAARNLPHDSAASRYEERIAQKVNIRSVSFNPIRRRSFSQMVSAPDLRHHSAQIHAVVRSMQLPKSGLGRCRNGRCGVRLNRRLCGEGSLHVLSEPLKRGG